MDKPDAVLIMSLTQGALALAIWGDKVVHRILGKKSMEARLVDVEGLLKERHTATTASLDELHEKASEYAKSQQIAIGRVEARVAAHDITLAQINEHLKNTDKNVERLERRRGDR